MYKNSQITMLTKTTSMTADGITLQASKFKYEYPQDVSNLQHAENGKPTHAILMALAQVFFLQTVHYSLSPSCPTVAWLHLNDHQHNISDCVLLNFVLWILSEMQENKTEDNNSKHHGKGSCIVWICRHNEPLILRVLQRTNRHLQCNHATSHNLKSETTAEIKQCHLTLTDVNAHI